MESVEKIPKSCASIAEDVSVETANRETANRETASRRRAKSHLAVVTEPPAAAKPAGVPEQVGLGGRDGNFLSCLRVPGVSGYLIVC